MLINKLIYKPMESNEPTQRDLSDFVNREVLANQTSLVNELMSKDIIFSENIENYWQKKCSDCGGKIEPLSDQDCIKLDLPQSSGQCNYCPNTYGETAMDELEDEPAEVLEWWLVSDWLLARLEEQNEVVIDCEYGNWWGRTCSGQAIAMDSVIKTIYKKANLQ